MSRLVINGGRPLCGVVRIQGAKNSVLPILAASLLADEPCVISNCPHISDADTAVEILEALGARAERYSGRVETDASNAFKCVIPDGLMRKMRSSIVFLGAIVSKCGRARVSFPGGCDIGCRPIDLHIVHPVPASKQCQLRELLPLAALQHAPYLLPGMHPLPHRHHDVDQQR